MNVDYLADMYIINELLKTECIHRTKIKTFAEARDLIDDYIYFYNHQRIQLKTKLTPLELRSQFLA